MARLNCYECHKPHTRIKPVDEDCLRCHTREVLDRKTGVVDGFDLNEETLALDVIHPLVEALGQSNQTAAGEVYLDGLSNVLAEPEFAEASAARRALRVFEERAFLEDLLSRTILTHSVGGVQVLIGGEGTWEELRECSMVLGRYGVPGLATGTVGVLGPIRMAYGRTISTVRFVAGLLSDLVVDLNQD